MKRPPLLFGLTTIMILASSCVPSNTNIIHTKTSPLIYTTGQSIDNPLNASYDFVHTIIGEEYGYIRYVGVNFPTSLSYSIELSEGILQTEIDRLMPQPKDPKNGEIFKLSVPWYTIVADSMLKPSDWDIDVVSTHIKRKIIAKEAENYLYRENADIILQFNFPESTLEGEYPISFDIKNTYDNQLPVLSINFILRIFHEPLSPEPRPNQIQEIILPSIKTVIAT